MELRGERSNSINLRWSNYKGWLGLVPVVLPALRVVKHHQPNPLTLSNPDFLIPLVAVVTHHQPNPLTATLSRVAVVTLEITEDFITCLMGCDNREKQTQDACFSLYCF